ncbi:alpha/beta fold hydrolase [Vibrio cidicii]|uniref:alpha/beta fold hydrolase n=1 Tax=Vibrio cidicii TaxID=1763883 RepID=UPI0037512A64
MKTFEIDGHQMAYQDVGQGPVLLFGHSYLWDSQMWAPQIEWLSQSYRCIVPELWAHGQSQAAPANCHSLGDYARHVLALMDHLAIEQFSVVGLSVGGMWGAELVSQAPARVTSLVLMDTFIGLEPEVTHKKYFAMLDAISQSQLVPPPIVEAVVPLFFANDAKEKNPQLVDDFTQKLASLSGEQAVQVARVGRMVFGRRDVIEDAENFALPTLIAVGREDKPRPVFESYLMQDVITASQLIEIPNAGHISNLEQPEFVNRMLSDFFAQVYA